MRVSSLILGTGAIFLGTAVTITAAGFPTPRHQAYGPGFFPALIGSGFIICGAVLIVQWFRHERGASLVEALEWMRMPGTVFNVMLLIVAPLVYIFLVNRLGFILTIFALLFVLIFRFYGQPRHALIFALVVPPILQFTFSDLLLVPLPWGILQALAW